MVYSDSSELDPSDEIIRIKNVYFGRKLWWKKTAENDRYCYVAEKCTVSKLSKISIKKISKFSKLQSKDCV